MAGIKPFSYGHFGIVPNPPEYDYPEYEGCPYEYETFEQGDECIGCKWYEACKELIKQ